MRRGRMLRLYRTGIWPTNHRPITPTISVLLGDPITVAAPPPGRGCVCGPPMRIVVATAAQILGESEWRLWMRVFFAATFRCIPGRMQLNFLSVGVSK
jgi:hypothetical protein